MGVEGLVLWIGFSGFAGLFGWDGGGRRLREVRVCAVLGGFSPASYPKNPSIQKIRSKTIDVRIPPARETRRSNRFHTSCKRLVSRWPGTSNEALKVLCSTSSADLCRCHWVPTPTPALWAPECKLHPLASPPGKTAHLNLPLIPPPADLLQPSTHASVSL